MLIVSSFRTTPEAAPLELTLEAGEVRVITAAPPDLGRGLAMLRRPQTGSVVFEGQDLTRLGEGALRKVRRRLQYVGGDPRRSLLPRQTVAQTLSEPLQIHKVAPAGEIRGRSVSVARGLGLSVALLEREVGALSAALRWRLLVARSLTLEPGLLIIDSPAAYVSATLLSGLLADVTAARGPAALLWLGPVG